MSEETIAEAIEAEKRLSVKLGGYKGQWVAVRNHDVVASAATLPRLLKLVEMFHDASTIDGIFRVSEQDGPFFGEFDEATTPPPAGPS